MTVDAVWDRSNGGGWSYRFPGLPYNLTPSRRRTSIVSSNSALVAEAKRVAAAAGVRLPSRWELLVKR